MAVYIKSARKDMGPIAATSRRSLRFPDMVVLVEGPDESLAKRRGRRDNRADRQRPRLNEAGRRGLRDLTQILEHQALHDFDISSYEVAILEA